MSGYTYYVNGRFVPDREAVLGVEEYVAERISTALTRASLIGTLQAVGLSVAAFVLPQKELERHNTATRPEYTLVHAHLLVRRANRRGPTRACCGAGEKRNR